MPRMMLENTGLKIGLFSSNISSGGAVTTVPERWQASWRDNLSVAKLADAAGLDFLLPVARWIGFGGKTNASGSVLDPVTWAAGLLAATENISVFATVHSAFNHPVVTAKQIATLDQIGQGRAGLNIVAGWNKPEYEAFGLELPAEHEQRYALSQEWIDIIRKLWATEGRWDHSGQSYHLKQVTSDPKPVSLDLPIISAGASPQGKQFAARNADFLFTPVQSITELETIVRGVQELGSRCNRRIRLLTLCHVVCRPTEREAVEYYKYYSQDNVDELALENMIALQGMHAKSFSEETLRDLRQRFAGGGGSYPLVGTPDQISDTLERFYALGLDGTTLSFVNYTDELPYFTSEVLGRLEARGVRKELSALQC